MQYKTEFYAVKGNSRRGGYQWSGSARRITPPKLPRGFGRETFGIRVLWFTVSLRDDCRTHVGAPADGNAPGAASSWAHAATSAPIWRAISAVPSVESVADKDLFDHFRRDISEDQAD